MKQSKQKAGEGDINLSPRRAAWRQRKSGTPAEHWLEKDNQYFFHQSLSTPCLDVLQSCSGSVLTNLEGDQYLDFHGNSVHQIGFSHPKVIAAVKEQMEELPFCTRRYTNIPAIQLAAKLCTLMGGNYKVLFAPGATTAIGMALKLMRRVTGRFKTISMWDSFHGASLDAISVGGEAIFRSHIGPLLPGTEHVPPPNPVACILNPEGNCTTCDLRCARYIEYVLEKEGDIGAVIAEPIRCTAVNPPPEGFWKTVRKACDAHGAMLIFDETAICLGRTGRMFAYEHYVEPDILVLGKGLGGGLMPLAAMLARNAYDHYADSVLGHYTHEKNPLCCAAGLASIEVVEDEGLVARSERLGQWLLEWLNQLMSENDVIKDVRGLGLMAGVWLDHGEQAEQVMYNFLEHGLSFKVSQSTCLTLTPPLTITEEQLEKALKILAEAITALHNHSLEKGTHQT